MTNLLPYQRKVADEMQAVGEELAAQGYPLEGGAAQKFIILSGNTSLPANAASSIMELHGYQPFKGLPLVRRISYLRGEIEVMQEEVLALETKFPTDKRGEA